jgi:hypothetical protein
MHATSAGRSVTAAVDQPAMGLDLDFEDGGVVGAREVGERLATGRAAALVGRQVQEFFGGRQMALVTATVSGVAALLSAWPSAAAGVGRGGGVGVHVRRLAVGRRGRGVGDRGGGELIGACACFGAAAEVLLAEEP